MEDLLNIRNQLRHKDLFEKFKVQLAKDFEQSNFSAEFVAGLEPDYSTILEIIARELKRNEKKSETNLMQLLYRVDISEAQLKSYLNERGEDDHFNILAELIIKRVLQKVVIKQYYKGSGTESN